MALIKENWNLGLGIYIFFFTGIPVSELWADMNFLRTEISARFLTFDCKIKQIRLAILYLCYFFPIFL